MKPVLVLYYSRHGSTKRLADAIAQGITSTDVPVIVRTVPSLKVEEQDQDGSAVIATGDPELDVPVVSLQELENCALDLGLSVLIEVHDEAELNRALKMKSKLLGINNRNLKTLEVDLNNSVTLSKLVPDDYVLVGESGIKTSQDIQMLKDVGINCFLIGEHFMNQDDIGQAVTEILK